MTEALARRLKEAVIAHAGETPACAGNDDAGKHSDPRKTDGQNVIRNSAVESATRTRRIGDAIAFWQLASGP
jgi:hypothetical protein